MTILGWPEREVWFMTPYKITTLWNIHREITQPHRGYNGSQYGHTQGHKPTATGTGDIDRAMDALGL